MIIHLTCIARTFLARSRSGFHQLGAHAGQGPALEAGHVHLGEADPGRDLVLVQVLEEPQDDNLAFQLRELRHQAGQGQQVLWLLPGSRRGQQVAEAKVAFVAGWLVKRHLKAAARGHQPFQDFLLAQLQVLGELEGGGGAAQALVQLISRPCQPQGLFLAGAGHMQPPAGVPQVAFELADHTGHGVGDERRPVAGVVAVDGGDQSGPGGLAQVLGVVLRLVR